MHLFTHYHLVLPAHLLGTNLMLISLDSMTGIVFEKQLPVVEKKDCCVKQRATKIFILTL